MERSLQIVVALHMPKESDYRYVPGGLAHSLDGHGALCWCFFSLGLAFLPLLRYSGQDVSQSPPIRTELENRVMSG